MERDIRKRKITTQQNRGPGKIKVTLIYSEQLLRALAEKNITDEAMSMTKKITEAMYMGVYNDYTGYGPVFTIFNKNSWNIIFNFIIFILHLTSRIKPK